jgi:hypothetical protein
VQTKNKMMDKKELSIPKQVELLLDGRTQRWLAMEIKMPETDLSKRMKGIVKFNQNELDRINARLNGSIKLLN